MVNETLAAPDCLLVGTKQGGSRGFALVLLELTQAPVPLMVLVQSANENVSTIQCQIDPHQNQNRSMMNVSAHWWPRQQQKGEKGREGAPNNICFVLGRDGVGTGGGGYQSLVSSAT